MKRQILSLSVAFLLSAACSTKTEPDSQGDLASLANPTGPNGTLMQPQAPLPPGQILSIGTPDNVKTGHCSPITLDWASASAARRGTIVFPDAFIGRIFIDDQCRSVLFRNRITSEALPTTLYFLSESLFFGRLEAEFVMDVTGAKGPSNAIELNAYRARYLDVTSTFNFTIGLAGSRTGLESFDPFVDTTSSRMAGVGFAADAGTADNRLLSSVTTLNVNMGFSRQKLYAGSITVETRANSVSTSEQSTTRAHVCYSAKNEIFCLTPGSANFVKVALPAGLVTDLVTAHGAPTCAVVSGRVHCWRQDLVPFQIPEAGEFNVSFAYSTIRNAATVQGTMTNSNFCVLKDIGVVMCQVNGNTIQYADGVRALSSGGRVTGQLLIHYVGLERSALITPAAGTTDSFAGRFDEIIPRFNGQLFIRIDKQLYFWDLNVDSQPIASDQGPYDFE